MSRNGDIGKALQKAAVGDHFMVSWVTPAGLNKGQCFRKDDKKNWTYRVGPSVGGSESVVGVMALIEAYEDDAWVIM